jgi:hypothetical protein
MARLLDRYINHIKRIEEKVGQYQAIKNPTPGSTNVPILNGEEQNAFRHALLNAAITSQINEPVAFAASAQHEGGNLIDVARTNGSTNFTQGPFESENAFRTRIDTIVDLKNNEIGRDIGRSAPKGSTVQYLTGVVADEFQNKGLFMPSFSRGSDGKLTATVSRQKLSPEKNNLIHRRLGQLGETYSSTTESNKIANANIGKIGTMLDNGNSLQQIRDSGFTAKDIAATLESKVKSNSSNNKVQQQNTNSVRVA